MEMQHLAMILLTIVISISIITYAVYMFLALYRQKEVKKITPSPRTYRLAFFIVILVVIAYLALGLGKDLSAELLGVLGTIAGYVLGGVTSQQPGENNLAPTKNESSGFQ